MKDIDDRSCTYACHDTAEVCDIVSYGYIKGKSSLMIFDKILQIKYKYGNRRFWSVGYYVGTTGLNEASTRKYIREQERKDIMLDKRTVREYTDPFSQKQGKLLEEQATVKLHGGLNERGADLSSSGRRP